MLRFVHLDTGTGLQVRRVLAGQAAVVVETAHIVVDIAVVSLVGIALVEQRPDHGQDLLHGFACLRLQVGPHHPQRIGVLVHDGDEALGQRAKVLAIFIGTPDDLVIDVGDVPDVGHVIAEQAQVAHHHVEHHHDARMTQVTVVVDRHAADIHVYLVLLDRHEGIFLIGKGVIYLQHRMFPLAGRLRARPCRPAPQPCLL